jgi:hypothetical protein
VCALKAALQKYSEDGTLTYPFVNVTEVLDDARDRYPAAIVRVAREKWLGHGMRSCQVEIAMLYVEQRKDVLQPKMHIMANETYQALVDDPDLERQVTVMADMDIAYRDDGVYDKKYPAGLALMRMELRYRDKS